MHDLEAETYRRTIAWSEDEKKYSVNGNAAANVIFFQTLDNLDKELQDTEDVVVG